MSVGIHLYKKNSHHHPKTLTNKQNNCYMIGMLKKANELTMCSGYVIYLTFYYFEIPKCAGKKG